MSELKKNGSNAAANSRQVRIAREREERHERIRQQVADGTLVIRQMTDAERAYWDERRPKTVRSKKPRREVVGRTYYLDDKQSSMGMTAGSIHGARLA